MLDLRFSMVAGRVEVSASANYAAQLNFLSSRFASSRSLSGVAFDVDIDDLLVNLSELATWPKDDSEIHWDTSLLRLASGNATDANTLATLLNSKIPTHPFSLPQSDQWKAELTDFQIRDISKLLALTHAANFSVPGAGKTRVSLAVFDRRRNEGSVRRMMVVCPKSAFESWKNEAEECFVNPPRVVVMDTSTPPDADIILINYERLPDSRTSLIRWLKTQPALLVLDEAHRMKLGAAGAWGATCLAIGPYAAARMILTGTPAPNGAKDLENLFSFVWPGQGRAKVNQALQSGDLQTASAFLRPLYSRTTKNELDLLPVKTTVKRVDLTPLHKELYRALLGHISDAWRGNSDDIESLGKILLYLLMAATTPALLSVGSSRHEPLPYRIPPLIPNPNSTLNELLRDLPQYEISPKYKEVIRIVGENAKKGLKTLVWSTFVRNLKSLESLLINYRPAIVHGGTLDREDQLNRFRNDTNCFVLLSNPATLGEGVSLHHECHDAVYVDRDFSAGRFMQSLDRIHRLGLAPGIETRVTVLVSNETIDEIVEQRLAKKLKFMGGVLDDPAVIALADLNEDPDTSVGMDDDDLSSLITYVKNHANS